MLLTPHTSVFQRASVPGLFGVRAPDPHRERPRPASPAHLHDEHDEGQLQVKEGGQRVMRVMITVIPFIPYGIT